MCGNGVRCLATRAVLQRRWHTVKHLETCFTPLHAWRENRMSAERLNMEGNGVKHASSCCADSLAPAVACGIGCRAARRDPPASAHARRPSNAARGHQPAGDGWESAIEPPPPCPKCGSLALWQDILGGWHCQHCEGAKFQRSLPRRAGCLASEGRPASRIRQGEAVTSKGRAEPPAWPLTAWTVWRRFRTSDCEGRLRSRCRAQGEPGNATVQRVAATRPQEATAVQRQNRIEQAAPRRRREAPARSRPWAWTTARAENRQQGIDETAGKTIIPLSAKHRRPARAEYPYLGLCDGFPTNRPPGRGIRAHNQATIRIGGEQGGAAASTAIKRVSRPAVFLGSKPHE